MTRLTLILAAIVLFGCQSAPRADAPAEPPNATLVVKGMTCPFCATNLEAQLSKVDGVRHSTIDLGSGNVAVWFAHPATSDDLRTAVERSGFTVESLSEVDG